MAKTQLLCPDFPALQLVRTGRIVRLLGRLTLYAMVATIIIMLFVPWQQTAPGNGTVIALDPQQRPQPVLSPAEGQVIWVMPNLREGTYVEEGQTLLRIAPLAAGAVAQLELQIDFANAQLYATQQGIGFAKQLRDSQESAGIELTASLEEAVKEAESKLAQVKNKLPVAQADYDDKLNKYTNAAKVTPRLVSPEALFSMKQDVIAAENKLAEATNAIGQAEAGFKVKKLELASKAYDVKVKNDKADVELQAKQKDLNVIKTKLSELETKMEEYERLEVPAPRSGFIHQWNGVVGSDIIKKQDRLCIIVPEATELAVELQVTGNDMPLIHEGDRVRLQFHGWPAVQFVGWPSVAVGTFGGKVNRAFPTDDGKGNFKVLVTPSKHFDGESDWPDNRYLRQGVRANGWVLLRKVPLGYEIWRQLNGFPPVVSDEEPTKNKGGKGSKVKLPKA